MQTTDQHVREATVADAAALRSVANASLEASYSLSPSTIAGAVEEWYAADAVAEKLDDEGALVLVAEDDDGVIGFSESELVDDHGDILWLHVDPIHRGAEVGESLYERTRSALEDAGAEVIRGRVLADNSEGNAFYEHQGMQQTGQSSVDVDGDDHVENIYVDREPSELTVLTRDGRDLYADSEVSERGSKAPFFVVYSTPGRDDKYGFYCSNCESLVTSMDSMGRMECTSCGNARKPTRWDAAHL